MSGVAPNYSRAGFEVRGDLQAVHGAVLDHFRRSGSWFSGAERIAIAAETRRASGCPLCLERKAALSPEHLQGKHASAEKLAEPLVDVIHRVRVDPGRLSRRWFEATLASGLSEGEYVEAVGIIALTAGLDAQCRALGIPPFPLPEPLPGSPTGHSPKGMTSGIAWVPLLRPEDATGPETDLYDGAEFVPNIMRALSLVPGHIRVMRDWLTAHYVDVRDRTARRAIDRSQIEFVAARVSALNECFY